MLSLVARRRSFLLVPLVLLATARVDARTWNVPGDAPTVQAGIDSAVAGDSVLVAPGTYAEPPRPGWGLSMIILKSGVVLLSSAGAAATVLDAQGQGRVVLADGVNAATRVAGFTIRGGDATGGPFGGEAGDGILCLSAGATIANCAVIGNTGGGSGIYVSNGRPVIVGCTITGNAGGGVAGFTTSGQLFDILDCVVAMNDGPGISASGDGFGFSILRTHVSGNSGRGISAGGIGGGSVEDCFVRSNTEDGVFIAGISLGVMDTEISENGGNGVRIEAGSAALSGTVIANSGTYGIRDQSGLTSVVGCTIVGSGLGGILYTGPGSGNLPELTGSIVSHSTTGPGLDCQGTAPPTVRCCDVWGNAGGDAICGTDSGGNFSQAPLYCDRAGGDFTLHSNSPCLPGNHPQSEPCGLVGALDQGCGVTSVEPLTWGALKGAFR